MGHPPTLFGYNRLSKFKIASSNLCRRPSSAAFAMPVRPAPVAVLVSARSAGVGGQQSSRLGQTSSRKGKVAKGAAGKAVKKKSVASKKAKLPDDQMAKLATLAPAFAKAIESLPWMNDVVPAFSTALDNLPAGNKQQLWVIVRLVLCSSLLFVVPIVFWFPLRFW